jgi:malonyl CoA-acyl carrier protein transacylase
VEPIAIIGIGCRFPGASNPEAFWELLRDGRDAISVVPPDRWNIDTLYDPEPGTPGKMNTRHGGFLDQVEGFDAAFFGISPRETAHMDPQQRLVLEVAWESLENAGIVPATLAGSQTGVFIGCGSYDYGVLLTRDLKRIDAYAGTGLTIGIAANRLSYLLDLRGPSLAIETACSSSLVAVHLACQSLQNKESNLCVAGAVSLMLSPEQTVTYSQAKMMADDGRCKTFDASANGYVRGEGCGIVILKRLSDAIAQKDPILAVIRGSAVNQDGLTNGLTAPNGPSQQAVIRQALSNAGVMPAQVSYIEAHGTGTALGDPIEMKSLKAVLMPDRPLDQPCWIGSVKTNIGHLEAAAGMAGLIKVVLSLQHRQIPPHLNLKQLNPYISLEGTSFIIPTECQSWTVADCRIAGVSSFGFGGTNAHVIVEAAPDPVAVKEEERDRLHHILTLSAKSETALTALAKQYHAFLVSHPKVEVADVCFTANVKRSHFNHRLSVIAASTDDLCEKLEQIEAGIEPLGAYQGLLRTTNSPKVAFLFTGQGSQYLNMGRQLYETQPVFRQVLDRCNEILQEVLEQPLLDVLYPEADQSPLDETAYTQPALFAIEYALFQLWRSWGVEPAVVLGHSVGEYVAACVAGVFSLEDGLKLIAERGRLMQALPRNGEMVAVLASETLVNEAIQPYTQQVSIAALNGPENVVIAGERQAVGNIITALQQQGIETRSLKVSHAFHSPLMEPMLAEFEQVLDRVTFSQPHLDIISNLTGELATAEIATPAYWLRHVRQAVRFADSLKTLYQQKYRVLVEIGAKPTLLGMARHCLPNETTNSTISLLPSLRFGKADWQQMLESLGALYVRGVTIDWAGFDRDYSRHHLSSLPTYPWQRQRYWISQTEFNEVDSSGNGHQSGLAQAQTQIMQLLSQGNVNELSQLLQTTGNLSAIEAQCLPKILETLIYQNQQQLSIASIQDWLYQVEWQACPRHSASTPINEPGSWLIFADRTGVGQSFAAALGQEGQRCLLIYPEAFQCQDEAIDRFLENHLTSDHPPLKGVIHLWSLNTAPTLSLSALQQAQNAGCVSVLHLIQALTKRNFSTPPKLWFITQAATSLEPSLSGLAQSPLWGLGKVIALEYPEWWGGLLDLPAQITPTEITTGLAEILDSQGEDQIALRAGKRYVARLVPQPKLLAQPIAFQSDQTYLITGGLGSLGISMAQWMVAQGVRYLVLLSRRAPSEQAQAAIASMQQAGAKVLVTAADVSNAEAMKSVWQQMQVAMPPLRGVIHAAGIVDYQAIAELSIDAFEKVLRPKLFGAWNLHQLTQDTPLDFFITFSSIASVWGSKGQAHYAAANQFLDVLAHYRRGLGLPGLSVNWGPWAEGGMAVAEFQAWLTRMGVKGLANDRALLALGHLLASGTTQSTVVDISWQLFKPLYEVRGTRSLLRAIEVDQVIEESTSAPTSKILQQLEDTPISDRHEVLMAYLQSEVARVLGLSSAQLPDPHEGFFAIGMDSLMAVELKNRLEANLKTALPGTLIFEAPTIHDLTHYLAKVLGWTSIDEPEVTTPEKEHDRDNEAEVELSEAELEASIAEKLLKLESLVRGN